MFLSHVRTLVWKALREVFDVEYPNPQFRDIHVSREYPIKRDDYPAIWVDFDPAGSVRNAGIGHYEVPNPEEGEPNKMTVKRWTYRGATTFTVVTLDSLERDLMVDEVIKVVAHGTEHEGRAEFRALVEDNELIACQMNWDEIQMRGAAVTPGTPWGTDDLVYEWTLAVETLGEFLSDGQGDLVPISEIRVHPIAEGTIDPTSGSGWI